jgi:DNA-directed RNA polymerase subunit RPC12/RpoP
MKKIRGMMYPKTKEHKTQSYKCARCNKELTPSTAYFYVDSCNCAITDNAPPHCYDCYKIVYKGR